MEGKLRYLASGIRLPVSLRLTLVFLLDLPGRRSRQIHVRFRELGAWSLMLQDGVAIRPRRSLHTAEIDMSHDQGVLPMVDYEQERDNGGGSELRGKYLRKANE